MNKLEEKYADLLEGRRVAGEIVSWMFESVTLVLAHNTRYTPDFMVVHDDHFAFHEVKGFAQGDWQVKHKVAVKEFPWFEWVVVSRKKSTWIFDAYGVPANA